MKKMYVIIMVLCFSALAFVNADGKTGHMSVIGDGAVGVESLHRLPFVPDLKTGEKRVMRAGFKAADVSLKPGLAMDIPVNEVEPNDTIDIAQDLGTATSGDPFVVSGSFSNADDDDLYTFTLPAAGCILYELEFNCAYDYDLYAFWNNPADGLWYQVTYSWYDCPEVISAYFLDDLAGLWAIVVDLYSGTPDVYTLTIFWDGTDADGDGYPYCGDCDDTNADINPGAREDCTDGIDNDCDNLVDLDDQDCNCPEYDYQAVCGDIINGDTTGGTDDLDFYSCIGWDESGPDDIYQVYVDEQYLLVELTNLAVDLDVFVLSEDPGGVCPFNCVTYDDSLAIYEVPAAGNYYVVADGYGGAEGAYTLEIICCHDTDGDGFLDAACGGTWGADCDDSDPDVNPLASEVCDGLDNDCDGVVDDGDPGGGGACDTGEPGICAAGTLHCTGGSIMCVRDEDPSPEVCDGLDNDCDGTADDGNPGGGGACDTGLPGVCADGTQTCQNGTLECVQDTEASPEVCDGLDNDCDGVVDDGDPGGGGACDTGEPGICAAGTLHCTGGSIMCVRDEDPNPEVCDGLDNDCDSETDEGGDALCEDAFYCNGAETCDGVNGCQPGSDPCPDDGLWCNGSEGCNEDGDVCTSTGDPCEGFAYCCEDGDSCSNEPCGCQDVDGDGFYAIDPVNCPEGDDCDDDPGQCGANCHPGGTEACDGFDNDCDGQTDEEIPPIPCPLQDGVCAGAQQECVGGGWTACDYGLDYEETEATCDDSLDNDCDSQVDGDDPDCDVCWDNDGDGYDDEACGGDDCDDSDAAINPGMQGQDCLETPDGVDNDCDGQVDEDKCQGCFIGLTM